MTIIALGGDVHGNTGQVKRHLELANKAGATHYFQLGDWNLSLSEDLDFQTKVENMAEMFNIDVAWLDGNHDDFPYIQFINPENRKEFIKTSLGLAICLVICSSNSTALSFM